MKKLTFKILAGILTVFLAKKFVPGVYLRENLKSTFLIGASLGLVNFFLKPILKFVSLPLRLLTLNFFSILINLGLIKLIDFIFLELEIKGFLALFITTSIFLVLEFIAK